MTPFTNAKGDSFQQRTFYTELADTSVNLTARAWTSANDYWAVYFDTTEKIKKQFDAHGVSIPFPQ